ncbi:MAG: hypothetical protein FWD31_07985, partial [Planctomycetaceae bacterium]|nr:hypothetical protein [Planctomycetaceae bacterium]
MMSASRVSTSTREKDTETGLTGVYLVTFEEASVNSSRQTNEFSGNVKSSTPNAALTMTLTGSDSAASSFVMTSSYIGSDSGGDEVMATLLTGEDGTPLDFSEATYIDMGMTFSGSDSATTEYIISSELTIASGDVTVAGDYYGSVVSTRNYRDWENVSLHRHGAISVEMEDPDITWLGYAVVSKQSNFSTQTTIADWHSELDGNGEWQLMNGDGIDEGNSRSDSYLATTLYMTVHSIDALEGGTLDWTANGFSREISSDTYTEDYVLNQTVSGGDWIVTSGTNDITITIDDSTLLSMHGTYIWSPVGEDEIEGHIIITESTSDFMDAIITETADSQGEWSTSYGKADAVSSGESSTIMTQNDTEYLDRVVPHGTVAGYHGGATRDWASYEFTSELSLGNNDEWQLDSGDGWAAAGYETGTFYWGGFEGRTSANRLGYFVRPIESKSGLTSVITESGYSGCGYGVKVYYAVVEGEWVEGEERLLVTVSDDSSYRFDRGSPEKYVRSTTGFSQYGYARTSFRGIIELDKVEYDTLGTAGILTSHAVATADSGDGHNYSKTSRSGVNRDIDRRAYSDETVIYYSLVEKEPDDSGGSSSGGSSSSGGGGQGQSQSSTSGSSGGGIDLDDYEWAVSGGRNVQSVNNYVAQDRLVPDTREGVDPKKNFEKYHTTIDVSGEIYSEYNLLADEWQVVSGIGDPNSEDYKESKITTHVVDEVLKKWYLEDEETLDALGLPITLFGEAVTLKKIDEGHSKKTANLTEYMTPLIGGLDGQSETIMVYNGEGTYHIDAKRTQREHTTGSAIAYYSERETQWLDRTLTLEIPENSEDNEWDIVSGVGKSGGERGWDFYFTPEEKTKPYLLGNYGNIDQVLLDGTSTLTESLNGFYSDSYKGEDVYDVQGEVWLLVSGSGSGNGENKFTNKNSLNATLSYLLGTELYYSGIIPYYATGDYASSRGETNAETFKVEFTVDSNGAWQREITHKGINTIRESYDFSFEGSCTIFTSLQEYHERNESGKLDKTVTTTEEWQPGVLLNTRDWISYEQDITEKKTDHTYNKVIFHPTTMNTSGTLDQDYTLTKHKEGISPGSATETFDINGTTSGKSTAVSGSVHIIKEFKDGQIYRDPSTNLIAGKSLAMSDCSDPDPTQSHDWMAIDYNGFTDIRHGVNTVDPKIIKHNFDAPHTLYLGSFTGYSGSVTLDYNGNGGVGVTFGEPLPIPTGTFDSGIDKFLPPPEAPPTPKYVPMSLTGLIAAGSTALLELMMCLSGKNSASSTLPQSKDAVQQIVNRNGSGSVRLPDFYATIIMPLEKSRNNAVAGAITFGKILWGDFGLAKPPRLRAFDHAAPEDYCLVNFLPRRPCEATIAKEIMHHLLAEYPIDPDCVTVAGLSSGGSASWNFAADEADLVAAVAPFSSNPPGHSVLAKLKPVSIWAFNCAGDQGTPI